MGRSVNGAFCIVGGIGMSSDSDHASCTAVTAAWISLTKAAVLTEGAAESGMAVELDDARRVPAAKSVLVTMRFGRPCTAHQYMYSGNEKTVPPADGFHVILDVVVCLTPLLTSAGSSSALWRPNSVRCGCTSFTLLPSAAIIVSSVYEGKCDEPYPRKRGDITHP